MKIQIENGLILKERSGEAVCEPGILYLEDERIAGVDRMPEGFVPDRVIDAGDKLVMPGLVNCHTHTYMSLFRNLADDIAFDEWLFSRIMPMEDRLTPEDAYWGAALSCLEMIRSGSTAFLDMHMFQGKTAQAALDVGMRGVISRGLTGSGRDEGGERRIREAMEEYEEYGKYPTLTFMLAPHAIYTCDTEYLEIIRRKSEETGLPIHVHLSETRQEFSDAVKKYGKTPVRYLKDLGLLDRRTVVAHCVQLTDDDIGILADTGVHVALNPKSNMKLSNGFAPVEKMLSAGVSLCIGTDSAASNNALNLFSEMNMTAMIHKGKLEDARAVTAAEVLHMATEGGADALGIDAGVLKEGKLADIILLDLNTPQMCPRNNLIS
ncbi:MAG: amidohydrolase, partial [Clostridiales bacterium]|nr:amidohydrolase [Clostridiales bacterium]